MAHKNAETPIETQDERRFTFYVSLALFILALLPRLLDLGRFLTPDEFLWIDRSRNFLAGLTNPAYRCHSVVEAWGFAAQGLACTLRTGHPGVTTMWTGSFGFLLRWLWDGHPGPLHDYVAAVSTDPLEAGFIAPERLGTVLLISLWVVAVYWLARRLFGSPIALLGSIFIALDPFHIALSRVIHHDALSTAFMTLAVLCALIYWGEKEQGLGFGGQGLAVGGRWSAVGGRGWLILSGLLAGFAFLSKLSSLYLMPFIALTGLWFTIQKIRTQSKENGVARGLLLPTPYSLLLTTILEGLLWFAAAIAVVFAFWPAMWVAPWETVQTAFLLGFKYTTGGHAKGNFLLGQISNDPGALFYPVTWLYRTTPLVLVGVIAGLIAWGASWRINKPMKDDAPNLTTPSAQPPAFLYACLSSLQPFFRHLPLILLFILGYSLLMTIGEKKQERYLLPVYPWLNFIAAAGLVIIYDWLTFQRKMPDTVRRTPHPIAVLVPLILIVNGYFIADNFPYYFTYYNPLLGGIHGAARAVTVGWGEGLDLAAAYLNQNTDPTHTRVASWYESTFAPFYHGDSISYSKEKGKALAGDYVIFYINQTQRRFPDEVMFDYFEKRFEPKQVIPLHGLDYAWIYPSLGIDHYLEDQTYTGIASLLAWQWAAGDTSLFPGQPAAFDLYWEYLGKRSDEPFFFRLVDGQERVIAEALSQPVSAENPPSGQWRQGEIIAERGALTVPPGTPPGQYRLQIGFYTNAPAVTEGELLFTLPKAETLVTVASTDSAAFTLPASATSIDQPLGDSLTLLGATWPARLPASLPSRFPLDLYWRIEKAIPADFAVHAVLLNEADAVRQAWLDLSLAETIEPAYSMWQPGDIVHTSWQLDLPPEISPGNYYFGLVWPSPTLEAKTKNLSFGRVVISPAEMSKN